MALARPPKRAAPVSFGVFRPVGHVVIAFENEHVADEAAERLRCLGFDDEDLMRYSAEEEGSAMQHLLDHASDFAGFGYEVTLMRRYQALAHDGCGWLMVYAPNDAAAERAAMVARSLNARLAARYHRLLIEDLI